MGSTIIDFARVYRAIRDWAAAHEITVTEREFSAGKAGQFNGVTVEMNPDYAVEERIYYLIHALGSIVIWSLDQAAVQAMFNSLRDAKKNNAADPERLEQMIVEYRAFEIRSSEHAVWLLQKLEAAGLVAPYTNFMRADLASMTEFHRHGKAPVWRVHFRRWNEEVASGQRQVEPFQHRPIPEFKPICVENQEILQQQ